MFRHAVAQAVVESSGVEVARALLAHQQISTTIEIYTGVDTTRLVEGVVAHAKDLFDLDAHRGTDPKRGHAGAIGPDGRYAFAYDAVTIAENSSRSRGRVPETRDGLAVWRDLGAAAYDRERLNAFGRAVEEYLTAHRDHPTETRQSWETTVGFWTAWAGETLQDRWDAFQRRCGRGGCTTDPAVGAPVVGRRVKDPIARIVSMKAGRLSSPVSDP